MSATRDKNQRIAFVYSNLYQIYKKGKEEAIKSDPLIIEEPRETRTRSASRSSSPILRVGDLKGVHVQTLDTPPVVVRAYEPVEFVGKRIEQTRVAAEMRIQGIETKPISSSPIARIHQNQIQALSNANKDNPTVESLKANLTKLNELHSRLKFMLTELEELAKPSKE